MNEWKHLKNVILTRIKPIQNWSHPVMLYFPPLIKIFWTRCKYNWTLHNKFGSQYHAKLVTEVHLLSFIASHHHPRFHPVGAPQNISIGNMPLSKLYADFLQQSTYCAHHKRSQFHRAHFLAQAEQHKNKKIQGFIDLLLILIHLSFTELVTRSAVYLWTGSNHSEVFRMKYTFIYIGASRLWKTEKYFFIPCN